MARYTTVIIIIIINIIIIIVIADDDDGIVNSLCKMDCSGTVIFGRKRGKIMIIIIVTIACTLYVFVCVCTGQSKNGAKNTPRLSSIWDREKKLYNTYYYTL